MKKEDWLVVCGCGVEISPLFAYYIPKLRGHCPECGKELIFSSDFWKKAIILLTDILKRKQPSYISDSSIEEETKFNKLLLENAGQNFVLLRFSELLKIGGDLTNENM